MMEVKIFQVDAFTSTPFTGNPAGVVLDAEGLSHDQMQEIAKEMNLSETAFITPIDDDNYKARFFTPTHEVDLCGHATIASFYTLALKKRIRPLYNGIKKVFQHTKLGPLEVEIYYKDGQVNKVVMQQATPEDLGVIEDIDLLLEAFNLEDKDIGVGEKFINPRIISTGLPDIQLAIRDKERLDNLKVDLNRLKLLSQKTNTIGVHAFYLPKIGSNRVYVRNFAPLVGIAEEAATGTSNGGLAYLLKKEGLIRGNELIAIQGEALNRPSRIHCIIERIDEDFEIKVGGQAVIVLEGTIYLP